MVLQKYKLSSYGETKRLTGIDDVLVEPLLFTEKLYVFDMDGKRIGRFSLKIEKEEMRKSNLKILYVHISNRAYINGKLSESIVTGTVTTKLKTLEEIRYECSDLPESGKHERYMFLLREQTKYYLSVTTNICNVQHKTKTSIPFLEAVGLIGESSNALLLRILAVKGYEGILCLKTILSNGKKCKNYYVSKLSEQVVNGKKMQVLIVYRNITNHKKYNITMTFALTRWGQIIYLFWSNSKIFLHVDPDALILTNSYSSGYPGLEKHWHKDVQLYSKYLDKVDETAIKARSYISQNEKLKRIIYVFVEYAILMKPSDIVSFAIKYFVTFENSLQNKPESSRVSERESQEIFGGGGGDGGGGGGGGEEEGEEEEEEEIMMDKNKGEYEHFGEIENMIFGEE
ncbi:conserved hypothetical protein [Pediculus humanus corporis]|uniref:Ciliogenesis-associated TTC17-interacting protein N-terminal domain-containing protein n=1 Tax=Pediculus humanus subsp. corporis TaxID=121224 RepID=E0VIE2_PEDHC|nr:uncharacterized protein Phum_PHUM226560 [Pediculus humanus corporis]EEB13148.1 conserved hypothetical protein [Pediculus humanus corporis]